MFDKVQHHHFQLCMVSTIIKIMKEPMGKSHIIDACMCLDGWSSYVYEDKIISNTCDTINALYASTWMGGKCAYQ